MNEVIMTSEFIIESFDTATEARLRYLKLCKEQKYPSRETTRGKNKKYLVRYRIQRRAPAANIQADIVANFRATGARDLLDKHLGRK